MVTLGIQGLKQLCLSRHCKLEATPSITFSHSPFILGWDGRVPARSKGEEKGENG